MTTKIPRKSTESDGRVRVPGQRTSADRGASPASTRPADSSDTGTTRLLAAAAHLDEHLAERMIGEFLVEPWRSIPHSPGVDAAAVLGDAAAAHRRRQIRDAALLALGLVALIGQTSLVVAWLVLALVVRVVRSQTAARRFPVALYALVLVAVSPSVVGLALVPFVGRFGGPVSIGELLFLGEPGFLRVAGLLAVLGVLAVLVADLVLVTELVRRHFARSTYVAEPDSSGGGLAELRRIGRDRFASMLSRSRKAQRAADPGSADVVVFRGDVPFVGAGEVTERQSHVIPLDQKNEDAPAPPPLSARELHADIAADVTALTRSSSLGLAACLRNLRHTEQVLVSARHLVMHQDTDEARLYQPKGAKTRPAARISVAEARKSIDDPQEWARYYQCFQVEGWERDLTVSCYVTLGVDDRLLYLEWATCVLQPLSTWYRIVDDRRSRERWALRRAVTEMAMFPLSIVGRLHRLCRRFAPLRLYRGELAPAKYGADANLRELASHALQDYFHRADAARYSELFERSVLESVRRHLDRAGFKISDIDRIVQSVTVNGVAGSVFSIGSGSTAAGLLGAQTSAPASPAQTAPGGHA